MWANWQGFPVVGVLGCSKETGHDKPPRGEFICLIIIHLLGGYSLQGTAWLRSQEFIL